MGEERTAILLWLYTVAITMLFMTVSAGYIQGTWEGLEEYFCQRSKMNSGNVTRRNDIPFIAIWYQKVQETVKWDFS